MRTAVRESSLAAYHQGAQTFGRQESIILAAIQPSRDYTRRELAAITGIETSTISARVNALIACGALNEIASARKCSISRKTVNTVRLPPAQRTLFS